MRGRARCPSTSVPAGALPEPGPRVGCLLAVAGPAGNDVDWQSVASPVDFTCLAGKATRQRSASRGAEGQSVAFPAALTGPAGRTTDRQSASRAAAVLGAPPHHRLEHHVRSSPARPDGLCTLDVPTKEAA